MLFSLLLFVLACGGEPSSPDVSKPTAPTALAARSDVSIDKFAEMHTGAFVVDVRTPEEFASGHVPGAVNMPIDSLDPFHPTLQAHPKDEPVYLICEVGGRSSRAADSLAAAGFVAVNVEGGTRAWKDRGLPLE